MKIYTSIPRKCTHILFRINLNFTKLTISCTETPMNIYWKYWFFVLYIFLTKYYVSNLYKNNRICNLLVIKKQKTKIKYHQWYIFLISIPDDVSKGSHVCHFIVTYLQLFCMSVLNSFMENYLLAFWIK